MHKSIIIASSLLGSVYLFSKSLELFNKSEFKRLSNDIILLNTTVFFCSSVALVSSYALVFTRM